MHQCFWCKIWRYYLRSKSVTSARQGSSHSRLWSTPLMSVCQSGISLPPKRTPNGSNSTPSVPRPPTGLSCCPLVVMTSLMGQRSKPSRRRCVSGGGTMSAAQLWTPRLVCVLQGPSLATCFKLFFVSQYSYQHHQYCYFLIRVSLFNWKIAVQWKEASVAAIIVGLQHITQNWCAFLSFLVMISSFWPLRCILW